MNLSDVHRGIKKHKKRRRIGRGPGSGHGKTSGRGHKGQGSRAGYSRHPTFEGGRMPLVRRVPKRGFNNKWADKVVVVNVGQLETLFDAGAEVTVETLRERGLAKHRHDVLKILGNGELTKNLKVSAHRFSATAREKIEKAGGSITETPGPTPVKEKNAGKKQKAKPAKNKPVDEPASEAPTEAAETDSDESKTEE